MLGSAMIFTAGMVEAMVVPKRSVTAPRCGISGTVWTICSAALAA